MHRERVEGGGRGWSGALSVDLAEQEGAGAVVDLQIPFCTDLTVTRILRQHLG